MLRNANNVSAGDFAATFLFFAEAFQFRAQERQRTRLP